MIPFYLPIIFCIVCGSVYWLLQLYFSLRIIKSVPLLKNLRSTHLHQWPRVSVIVPARNEAATIQRALTYRLQDDYPNMEIVLINDRSTDKTPEIIDNIAQRDKRVKALHISELPDGWIGKVYALHQGIKHATGDWFLLSDADVLIRPGTLKRVIAYCVSRNLDHLAIFPEFYPVDFVMDMVLSVFIRMLCMGARIWAIEDKRTKASIGSGSFNLVRRSMLERTEGIEWLRLEPADDIALGQMLKKSGAHSSIVNGTGYVGVNFYGSLQEMAIGSERAVFTVIGNFSLIRLAIASLIISTLELSPLFFLLISNVLVHYVGITMLCMSLATSLLINKWMNRSLLQSVFYPLGVIILIYFVLRAGILGSIRGGIIWRDTFYPTKLLKSGRRYKF